jgi:hypothetical protein
MLAILPVAWRAGAAPGPKPPALLPAVQATHGPMLDFRLVEDPGPTPVHHSGIVAQTNVSRGASFGIGLLKLAPRQNGAGEWRTIPPISRSKKAAVRFSLRF